MPNRFIAERGSGSAGTAYNIKDHEVIDTERPAGARVVCRANGPDARMIADALNAAHAVIQRAARRAA